MPITIGNIAVYLGPHTQGAPDNMLTPILDFIDRAEKRQNLMIAVQEIDHPTIAEAIIRARLRGVNIDLVVEQSYLLGRTRPRDLEAAMKAGGPHEINRTLFSAILRSTADVKLDYNASIFHQKFMVLGDRVLTGSTNFTQTGVTKNFNHIVVIDDPVVARAYRAEFREIRAGRFGKASVDHSPAPKETHVSGVRVKPLFAPDHAPEMEIMKQILKASTRVDFAIFTFSKSSGIDDALVAAKAKGTQIRGVLDRRQANQTWAAKHTLTDAGIAVHVAGGRGGIGKVHHKLMTLDDQVTIFGSFNYTGPANKLNDENIVVVGDADATSASARTAQTSIARACREEIDRIINTHG